MDDTWKAALKGEFSKEYFKNLVEYIKSERADGPVYPPYGQVFTAFEETPLDRVKVVILGQDPYHGAGQAHGLSFSVLPGVKVPPSLVNVYKELESDIGVKPVTHGYLKAWARRGVFLLNTILTVRAKSANSHKGCGWEVFTDRVIQVLNERELPMVFLLWGKNAQEKASLIDTSRHKVLPAAHPSPLSGAGFLGSKPFSQANLALSKVWIEPVEWALPSDPNEEVQMIEPVKTQEAKAPPVGGEIDDLLKSIDFSDFSP
jgi:uracil-DNA glycosylase